MSRESEVKNDEIILKVYNNYLKLMRGTVYKRIPNIDIVDDIVQECMLKFIRHSDTLNSLAEPQLISYIRITVEHTTTDYIRKNEPNISLEENINLVENLTVQYTKPVDDEIELLTNKEIVIQSIKKLRTRDRDLISLKYVQDIPDEQIADIMGIKPSSVRMTLHRSVKHLKSIVKEISKDD